MVELVPQRRGIGLAIERFGPLALTCGAMLAIYLKGDSICAQFGVGKWQTSNLYAAVFSWSAIQIGFAFSVYGFVVGRNAGFVEALRETLAMRRFMGYVKRANIGGFLLTVASLPLTVVNPSPSPVGSLEFWLVLLWFGLFIWTFLALLRIAYSFGHLSSIRDQPTFYGA